jgi:hypothetical protein
MKLYSSDPGEGDQAETQHDADLPKMPKRVLIRMPKIFRDRIEWTCPRAYRRMYCSPQGDLLLVIDEESEVWVGFLTPLLEQILKVCGYQRVALAAFQQAFRGNGTPNPGRIVTLDGQTYTRYPAWFNEMGNGPEWVKWSQHFILHRRQVEPARHLRLL